MGKTICLLNQKGGVGKTSTCHHLAGTLAKGGRRVLLVDNDPQASLTQGFWGPEATRRIGRAESIASVYDSDTMPIPEALVRPTGFDGISIVPGSKHLTPFNMMPPETWPASERGMREFLSEVRDDFDVTLIDCPPNLHLCSRAALVASDFIVCPVQVEDYGAQGLEPVQEAVEEVREFVAFLRDPGRFASIGARMPSGLLLHGPPGTGKTLLAKALAGEAEASFFAASGSEFMEHYVGVGAARVRQLFARARRAKGGAVVFIDELDAIGKRRADISDSASREHDHTLNQLLSVLDGFTPRDRVVCVAATNRIELLDPALLRPGRLSRHVLVDLPSADGRRAILDVHARGKRLADDVDLDQLAQGTAGRSGADLADLLNEGAIIAARAGRDRVGHADLDEGHLRVLAGPAKRSSPLSDEEREVVAYHEAGHALVAELCPSHDKTHRLSIRPRGRAAALAVTAARDRTLHSTRHVHEQLMVLLGGRAAERAVYGHVSSGAANDLEQANLLARRAVTELGFSARAGQLVADVAGRAVRLAEETHRVIDEEVERMIAEAYRDAIAMIEKHRAQLDPLAGGLVASEELDRLEIAAALGESRPRRAAPPEAGPRPEPALRRQARSVRRPATSVRSRRRRLAPVLAGIVTLFVGRANRDRRAGVA